VKRRFSSNFSSGSDPLYGVKLPESAGFRNWGTAWAGTGTAGYRVRLMARKQAPFLSHCTFEKMMLLLNIMTPKEKYGYWLDIAQYDLDSAEAMIATGRWLYVVFMCQQAIEKLCKGLYTLYIDDNVPKIHDISAIVLKFSDKLPVSIDDEKYQLFSRLSSFYLNNRYPEFKMELSLSLSESEAKLILKQSKEVFSWLLTLKPSNESPDNTSPM
jgi:HEPN domain-containing protein